MNEYYSSQIYDFSNEITGFRFMPTDVLEELIIRFGLDAGVMELAFCQNYFREKEKRDPMLCELRLITDLISKSKKDAESSKKRRIVARKQIFISSPPIVNILSYKKAYFNCFFKSLYRKSISKFQKAVDLFG